MKKALVAGAASAVLAAMPVVGVFAVGNNGTLTDTLQLKIENTCAMTVEGERTADTDIIATGTWASNSYSGTVVNDHSYKDFASTTFRIICNDSDGYRVTVAADGLTATDVSATDYAWPYTAGAYSSLPATGADGASVWTISSTGNGQTVQPTSGEAGNVVATRSSALAAAGETFTVSYSAYVDSAQPSGDYNTTATYTFAQL